MPIYYLIRDEVEYRIDFVESADPHPSKYCLISILTTVTHHAFSSLTAQCVALKKDIDSNYKGYASNRCSENKKLIKNFLILKQGDQLWISDDVTRIDITDDHIQKKVFKSLRKKYLDVFPVLSKRTHRLLKFIGLAVLTAILLTLTILTLGTALGAILPGAIGFVSAISVLTGITVSSLVSVQGCLAFASMAMGSFLLGLTSLMATLYLGNLSQEKKFLQIPTSLKEKYNDLTPGSKAALAIALTLLGVGLMALGGWAMAAIIGSLAISSSVIGLATGFLSTLGGLVALSGMSILSGTAGMASVFVAIGFAEGARKNRQEGFGWVQHPYNIVGKNKTEKHNYEEEFFLDNDGRLKGNDSLFQIWWNPQQAKEVKLPPNPFKATIEV